MISIPKALDKLVKAGMSDTTIGKAIGRDQSSVNRMRNGKVSPNFRTGQKIVQLYERKCSQAVK